MVLGCSVLSKIVVEFPSVSAPFLGVAHRDEVPFHVQSVARSRESPRREHKMTLQFIHHYKWPIRVDFRPFLEYIKHSLGGVEDQDWLGGNVEVEYVPWISRV